MREFLATVKIGTLALVERKVVDKARTAKGTSKGMGLLIRWVEPELPLNSWSRETFEVYYFRTRENTHEESAKDLYRRV